MADNDSKYDRETWADKVQKLLAYAEGQDALGNSEEASAFRSKAEQLMNKYRIEEEELRAAAPKDVQLTPVTRLIRLCSWDSPYVDTYVNLLFAAARHAGCQAAYRCQNGAAQAYVTGFDIDVRYCEMLFLNASLVFAAHLEPAHDPAESEAVNIYRLRRAGKTRREIAVLLWGKEVDHSVPAHGKVQKIYEAECAARGEQPLSGRGVSRKVYAELYAKQFQLTFGSRLFRARTDAGLNAAGTVALANRAERVAEAFYAEHPHLRPTTSTDVTPEPEKESAAAKARREARYERLWAEQEAKRLSPAGQVGAAAGKAAADKVPLQGHTSKGLVG